MDLWRVKWDRPNFGDVYLLVNFEAFLGACSPGDRWVQGDYRREEIQRFLADGMLVTLSLLPPCLLKSLNPYCIEYEHWNYVKRKQLIAMIWLIQIVCECNVLLVFPGPMPCSLWLSPVSLFECQALCDWITLPSMFVVWLFVLL